MIRLARQATRAPASTRRENPPQSVNVSSCLLGSSERKGRTSVHPGTRFRVSGTHAPGARSLVSLVLGLLVDQNTERKTDVKSRRALEPEAGRPCERAK